MVYKAQVLFGGLQLHQILRDNLLSLNRMKILLISNKASGGLLNVFKLFEFNFQDIIKLQKVLSDIIDLNSLIDFKIELVHLVCVSSLDSFYILVKFFNCNGAVSALVILDLEKLFIPVSQLLQTVFYCHNVLLHCYLFLGHMVLDYVNCLFFYLH